MQFQRLMPSWLKRVGAFLLFSAIASTAWAFSFLIGEPQINGVLALTFPYETRMGNHHIRFSNPNPHFYEKSQEIGITLHISLKEQPSGQITEGEALVRGGIRFDNKQQQLQLVKPRIDQLDWSEASAHANRDLVKQVSQLVGQDLPVIVLLDIKQLTGNALTPTLRGITVKKAGIEVSL